LSKSAGDMYQKKNKKHITIFGKGFYISIIRIPKGELS
jgi:hypothetical protein